MTTTFTGEVRIPGSIENGLPSTITLDPNTVVLTAGGTELGRWNRADLAMSREPDGTFHLTLGREVVLFRADSPLEFAILSGMPGTGTAPTAPAAPAPAPPATYAPAPAPAPAPAVPPAAATPPAAPPPAPAVPMPPAATPQPAAPPQVAPPPAPATPQPVPPAPTTPPPAAPAPEPPPSPTMPPPSPSLPPPSATPVQPAATPPQAAPPPVQPTQHAPAPPPVAAAQPPPPAPQPPPPAPQPSAPPVHMEATAPSQPPVVPPPAAPPGTVPGASEAAIPAAAAPQPPRQAPPLEQAAPGEFQLQADQEEGAQQTAETPAGAGPGSTDFWDGFYAEKEAAGAGVATQTDMAPGAFRLTDEVDDAEEPDAAALVSDEEDADYAPAFSEQEDRGWSYDDPVKEKPEPEDYPPAFSSPEAEREDLVVSESRLQRLTGWRPSLPSFGGFSFGASDLGMRAREAFSLLDSVLEENDTDDIPKGLLVGLGAFAIFLGLVAVLIVLFS